MTNNKMIVDAIADLERDEPNLYKITRQQIANRVKDMFGKDVNVVTAYTALDVIRLREEKLSE